MKIQVRQGIFETNSSSVHSITMCQTSEYEEWKNGNLKYCDYKETFLPTAEADEINKANAINEGYSDIEDYFSNSGMEAYLSYPEFFENIDYGYETFEKSYNGITAFGYF